MLLRGSGGCDGSCCGDGGFARNSGGSTRLDLRLLLLVKEVL